MTPEELAEQVISSLKSAIKAGDLACDETIVPRSLKLDRPKNREHGDWASNVAMVMSKAAGLPPKVIADALIAKGVKIFANEGIKEILNDVKKTVSRALTLTNNLLKFVKKQVFNK